MANRRVSPRVKVDFETREKAISADLAEIKQARDFADEVAAEYGFDANSRYQLKLAMSEAVTNAIQHGSTSTTDRIEIRAMEEGGALAFYVRDTGRFVPRVRRSGEMSESGRGLEFMRRLMDEVELQPGREGTLVRFSKRP